MWNQTSIQQNRSYIIFIATSEQVTSTYIYSFILVIGLHKFTNLEIQGLNGRSWQTEPFPSHRHIVKIRRMIFISGTYSEPFIGVMDVEINEILD